MGYSTYQFTYATLMTVKFSTDYIESTDEMGSNVNIKDLKLITVRNC